MAVIFSMSTPQDEYANWLNAQIVPRIVHLLLVCLFPDHYSNEYWRKDSFKFFPSKLKLMKGNKYPTADFIFTNLVKGATETKGDFSRAVANKGMVVPHTFDYIFTEGLRKIEPVIKDVSVVLAQDKELSMEDYLDILTKHGM